MQQLALQERHGSLDAVAALSQLTLPNREDAPAQRLKLRSLARVARDRGRAFVLPELRVGLGSDEPVLTGVHMPEAPVDEDHLPTGSEDQVGLSGERLPVKPISISKAVQASSEKSLGQSVPAPNAPHVASTLFRRKNIHHLTNIRRGVDALLALQGDRCAWFWGHEPSVVSAESRAKLTSISGAEEQTRLLEYLLPERDRNGGPR